MPAPKPLRKPRKSPGIRTAGPEPCAEAIADADRLHSLSIRLLRKLRRRDDVSGLSAPRLSALSVIVFGGPISLKALAAAEQVRAPSMSRLVRTLEESGLVRRDADDADGRVVHFSATARGTRLLHAGRERRVAALADVIQALESAERQVLTDALAVFEHVVEQVR